MSTRRPFHLTISFIIASFLLSGGLTAQVSLKDLSTRLGQRWRTERMAAESLAAKTGMPVRVDQGQERSFELQRFENGMPRYYTTQNLNAARTISTDKVWGTGGMGYFLTGSEITLGQWDAGGVRTTHQEFGGRVTNTEGTLHYHATHVAGTMIAGGVSPTRKGMSPSAKLKSFDWNNDVAEMAAQASAGLRVSNHSYGFITGWDYNYFGDSRWAWFGDLNVSTVEDYRFGFYDDEAASWDAVAANAPYYLIVKSAGNDRDEGPGPGATTTHWVFTGGSWVLQTATRNPDGNSGYDCIEGAGISKNVLTVGAVDDLTSGYVTPTGVIMSSFSCWGPTDDGRIKPDIVANGIGLSSTLETADNAYGTLTGTSMASPNASGSIGLILQYYSMLRGNTLIRSSTMKGLIIHTADDAGTAPGPDYRFGWGLMNTLKAVQLMTADSADGVGSHLNEILMNGHDTVRILVGSKGLQPLKATLCWTDPAAPVGPPSLDPIGLTLASDFDLRIIKRIDQSTSFPWTLNPFSPALPATTGDNFRDNVEQVVVSSPANANYVVQITHKGTLASPRYVSLILSGNSKPVGSSIAVAPDSIDASIPSGSALLDSLLITNSSDSTLIYHVAVSPGASMWLSPVHADSGSVPPSGSGYFVYRINASLLSQWSTYSGTLTFASNAATKPLLAVDVDITTMGPKALTSPTTVIMDVEPGETGTALICVANIGTNPLTFTAADTGGSLPSWLSLTPDTGTVGAGDTTIIVVTAGDTLLPIADYSTMLAIESNDSSDGTEFVRVELHVGTRHHFSMNVANQWNLLSLPVRPVTFLERDHFPTAISAAFFYQGTYVARETLKLGHGFWMKFSGAEAIAIDGYTTLRETVDVNTGWNIIGSISSPVALSWITSLPGGIVTSRFYGYGGTYYPADTIAPGVAYWVKSNQTGKLILSSSPGTSPAGAIHILPTGELPPTPPDGSSPGETSMPATFALDQNFPNPFNPTTVISYQLPQRSFVTLKVYTILGSEVATLVEGTQDAGYKSVEWNGRATGSATDVPSGVYFCKLTAESFSATRKMLLLR